MQNKVNFFLIFVTLGIAAIHYSTNHRPNIFVFWAGFWLLLGVFQYIFRAYKI